MSQLNQSPIETREAGDVIIAKILEKKLWDGPRMEQINKSLFGLVESGINKLVLDLNEVEFLSSVARGILIRLYKKITSASGKLVIYGARGRVLEVLAITQLNKVFPVVLDEQAALAEMTKPIEIPKPPPQETNRLPITDQIKIACAKRLLELTGSAQKAKEWIDQVASEQ